MVFGSMIPTRLEELRENVDDAAEARKTVTGPVGSEGNGPKADIV